MNENNPCGGPVDRDVSIILPTYNESGNILTLIDRIEASVPEGWRYSILVVDDNSPDGTYEIVRKRADVDPRVRAILRTEDRGFAKSIRHGIEQADTARIIVMDSDLTHDPLDIPRLLHVGEVYDIVSGSRFCAGGRMVDTFHYVASMLFNWGLRLLIGTQVQDNLGGYFTARREVILKLPVDAIFYGYGEYYFRLLHFAQHAGHSIVEIPSSYLLRGTGKSKSNWSRMIRTYSMAAIKLRMQTSRLNRTP
jgi:dolichol-phosphate mannosyltransferase